ncbi:MAG TPA: hypothetical protein VFO65_13095 [Acidimicrobiales bacterium]|nr:hypothetical protein [Acidimicrobiales bacterium]
MVGGISTYGFFVVAGRALGPERYSSLSVLWTLVFFAAPGFLFPIEQEVSRAVSARRALGVGGGPVIRRAAVLGGSLVAGLVVLTLALSVLMVDHLFDGEVLLLVALAVALPLYGVIHLCRGAFSGRGRFTAYGFQLGGEGALRLVTALVLATAGVRSPGLYGVLIPLTAALAIGAVLARERNLLEPGPSASWSELSEALGWLLVGAVLAQGFVNASVPLVKVLADDGEQKIAGQFQAGLIITRVPLFFFQAVQAALLPKLSGLAAAGRIADFRSGLRRLVVVIVALAVAATAGAFAIGPWVLRVAFGSDYDKLTNIDLGWLALASGAFMLAQALSQALIALRSHAKAALGWVVAITVFAAGVVLGDGLLPRVELGLVTGSLAGVVAMAVLLRGRMARGVPEEDLALVEAIAPTHEIIEP